MDDIKDRVEPDQIISDVHDQRDESLRWFDANYYGELSEIYRNIRCRTLPMLDKNNKEIKDRTNVCAPDHFVMVQRESARLGTNPPNLRLRGGTQVSRDKATALLYNQWDRSGQQRVFRDGLRQAVAFGWSVEKTWLDEINDVKSMRRGTDKINREQWMGLRDAPSDEVEGAVNELGGELTDGERAQAITEFGDEVSLKIATLKYSGPIGKRIFIGDIFPEPGFSSLQKSAYIIEAGEHSVPWLKYWINQTSTDPFTGEEKPVFDRGRVDELLDIEPSGSRKSDQNSEELRNQLRSAIDESIPDIEARLRAKRYHILERHMIIDGRIVIDWVGEDSVYLGRLWYPWDTNGNYLYNELVLMPDLIGGFGNSSPRITRFLLQMKNTRLNQSTDFINNKLLPIFCTTEGAGFTDESLVRHAWGKELRVKAKIDIPVVLNDPQYPPEAWMGQQEGNREMQQVSPEMADYTPGSETNPQAGRLATTALLQRKAADSVTAAKVDELNLFLKSLLELRLYLTQQSMQDVMEIAEGDNDRIDKMEIFTEGNESREPRVITIDPMEIQEDMGIEPEAGSTMRVDDEFRASAKEKLFMMAAEHPDVLDKRKAAELVISTIPGVDASEIILPPPDPADEQADVRMSIGISIKWQELPADARAKILEGAGLPTEGTRAQAVLDLPGKVREAADNVAELNAEANPVGEGGAGEASKGRGGDKRPPKSS